MLGHGRENNGRLTAAPEGARWRLRERAAAGRAAAQVSARAQPDAPPSRRGWARRENGYVESVIVTDLDAPGGS